MTWDTNSWYWHVFWYRVGNAREDVGAATRWRLAYLLHRLGIEVRDE